MERVLGDLVRDADLGDAVIDGDPSVVVTSVAHDSRAVAVGALFCCLPGAHVDGHQHAAAAVEAGAVALLVERRLDVAVPQVVVPDSRRAMGHVAAAFWGHPARSLVMVGVTGT
ncbi:MAG: hypothetical protein RLZ14_2049, partial [Actinomycetota bacterium]